MAKTTISFTIEQEQLERVDALTEQLDRDRSSTLRLLIDTGLLAVDRPQPVRVLTDREQLQTYAARMAQMLERKALPEGAFPGADADMA
jgi:hypothetical protein